MYNDYRDWYEKRVLGWSEPCDLLWNDDDHVDAWIKEREETERIFEEWCIEEAKKLLE